jgi:hypothetical protein
MTQNSEYPFAGVPNVGEIILGVVRGDLSLNVLSQIGIDIRVKEGFYELESGEFDISVRPTSSDVAKGILKYSSRSNNELRKWAFFILGECGAIDLSAIESDPNGEVLIDALWDCSFQGVLGAEIAVLAKQITSNQTADEC